MSTDHSSSSLPAQNDEQGAFVPAFVRRSVPPPSALQKPLNHERLLRDSGFALGRGFAHPSIAVIEGLPA